MKKLLIVGALAKIAADCGGGAARAESCATADARVVASGVIERFAGNGAAVRLEWLERTGNDTYETSASNGVLTVRGNSPVALCRGFYAAVKYEGRGIASWSGNRFVPGTWADRAPTAVTSPFAHRYYMNVVTFGYTTPYWDWPRWEREIDWMALHGIDMPLALNAQEAIMARVYRAMGLTENEIGASFVGPAHFPWLRMCNISGIDAPLPASWHAGQVALQHRILDRMRELGMTPICPGFAGQVSEAFMAHYPNEKYHLMNWDGTGNYRTYLLDPESPRFAELQRRFITEWEREFGPATHYLIDSFNEIDVPPGLDLATYGERVYQSLEAVAPNAVWTMQGWMFGYQRRIWTPERLQQLLSRIPDDKLLILDLALDYSCLFWKQGLNCDFYDGFYGKRWVASVIPNMGGKTAYTGDLSFYARCASEVLRNLKRGKLVGFGFAPEGIENNEVLYELLSDSAWQEQPIKLARYLHDYSLTRYGKCPAAIDAYWAALCSGPYGSFTDHPRFAWQGSCKRVRETIDMRNVEAALRSLASVYGELKDNPLYEADLRELGAIWLGAEKPRPNFNLIDALLEGHPTHRLSDWLRMARTHGTTEAEKDYYETNARRIVTIWGPGVEDYSARLWSGLVRGYYAPRFDLEQRNPGPAAIKTWERNWVETRPPIPAAANPQLALSELLGRISRNTISR